MSKSKGNFFTVRDVADRYGYAPIRYLMISSHYRTPINYSVEIIEQCKSALERLQNCKDNLKFIMDNAKDNKTENIEKHDSILNEYKCKFKDAMDDDLNTADAIAVVFEFVKSINVNITLENGTSYEVAKKYYDLLNELLEVLGLNFSNNNDESLDEEIQRLIAERTQARKNRDFKTADKIRDDLKARNIVLEDTPNGVKWKFIK